MAEYVCGIIWIMPPAPAVLTEYRKVFPSFRAYSEKNFREEHCVVFVHEALVVCVLNDAEVFGDIDDVRANRDSVLSQPSSSRIQHPPHVCFPRFGNAGETRAGCAEV